MSEHTGDLLMSAARSLRRCHGAALAKWEITRAQSRALDVVCELGSARLSVLAERLRIATRSAAEVVESLEARGLATRNDDRYDRRATCVVATDEGRHLQALLDEARHAETDRFLAALSPDDRLELERILTLLVDR